MLRIYMFSLFLVLLLCASSAAQTTQVVQTVGDSMQAEKTDPLPQPSSTNIQFKERDPRYRLQKSDVIEIKFKFSPEFDQNATVQPDGFITLDEVGDIKVEGKTLLELTEAIRLAYRGILHDPVITILLKEFEKPFFIAAGQVGHPGKYELRADTTLVEAVQIAGGFTDASKHSQVVLFRHVSKETVEAKVFNVKQMLATRNLQEDPQLLPGDMLFVPKNELSKIQRYIPTPSMGVYLNPNPF